MGDQPVVGAWVGDDTQTLGVVRPSQARDSNHLLLRNGVGVVGDWDDNLP